MRYILRKGAWALATIGVVFTLTFFLIRLMPGSPVEQYYMRLIFQYKVPPNQANEMVRKLFGMMRDDPLHIQYLDYVGNIIKGNLGTSITLWGQPVSDLIVHYLPWTVLSVSVSMTISFLLGILGGMFLAYRRGSKFDATFTSFLSIMNSIPAYAIGLSLLVVLSIQLGIFPIYGSYNEDLIPGPTLEFIADVLWHLALPVCTYVVVDTAGWALTMRSSTISTLAEDYVMAAEARGIKDRRISISYVGRNAVLPLVTSFAIRFGAIFGGSVFIETVFSYPGLGRLLAMSTNNRDYPVMQGCLIMISVAVIMSIFLTDVLYSKIDPRVKAE